MGMKVEEKSALWGGGPKPKYKKPADQICAHCGATIEGSDLALISQAIRNQQPACSYPCNKALGQTS